jgi:uncharacterized protein (DUF58 family)
MLPVLLVALAASVSLASACGMSVKPTITHNAAAVLAGRAASTLTLHLQGLQAHGVVRVYVDDGSQKPFAGENDPRYVGYAASESAGAHNATIVLTGTDALRRATRNGTLHLRFVTDAGTDAKVTSATLDAPH